MSPGLQSLGSHASSPPRSGTHARLKLEPSALPACLFPLFVPVLLLLGLLYHCFIVCSHYCAAPYRWGQKHREQQTDSQRG
jgi:hypothetical protein